MTTNARIADILLTQKGYDGLYDWAMDQRRRVSPPSWEQVATALAQETEGEVKVRGQMLRIWLLRIEAERLHPANSDQSRMEVGA